MVRIPVPYRRRSDNSQSEFHITTDKEVNEYVVLFPSRRLYAFMKPWPYVKAFFDIVGQRVKIVLTRSETKALTKKDKNRKGRKDWQIAVKTNDAGLIVGRLYPRGVITGEIIGSEVHFHLPDYVTWEYLPRQTNVRAVANED